jgi:hypothetical protein
MQIGVLNWFQIDENKTLITFLVTSLDDGTLQCKNS